MRALSVRQPYAYLAGVLHGDGWLTKYSIGLRVSDEEFAVAFADALKVAYGRQLRPRLDERGYHLVRTGAKLYQFTDLRDWSCTTDAERAAWLRGFFDSEGNVNLCPRPHKGPLSWCRRVAMFSTEISTLDTAQDHLAALSIDSTCRSWGRPDAPGHKGSKQVYAVVLTGSQRNYQAFANSVGSSITRKNTRLNALSGSYTDPVKARRAAQLLGAATKRRRTDEQLPVVLAQIRALADSGEQLTQRCLASKVTGFWNQHRRYGTVRLVEMACVL